MMLKRFLCILMFCMMVFVHGAFAEEVYNDNDVDNSVSYVVDLGSGDGAVVIIGNNNSIYLQGPTDKFYTDIAQTPDGFLVNMNKVRMVTLDQKTFSMEKVVLYLKNDGTWDVLYLR